MQQIKQLGCITIWLLPWGLMGVIAAAQNQPACLLQKVSGGQAAFVTSGLKACNQEGFGQMCQDKKPTYKDNLATQTSAAAAATGSQLPWLGDGGELVQLMKYMQDHRSPKPGKKTFNFGHGGFTTMRIPSAAWTSFERLRFHDARQVLAFKESWTDEDTALLGALDNSSNGFTVGEFTTEAIKAQLPSVSLLDNLTSRGSLAIVGAGKSLAKHGQEIDKHDVVVRFNNHVGEALVPDDTGVRMDIHVVNKDIIMQDREDVLAMDLESSYPGQSYCGRWRPPKPHNLSLSFSNVTLAIRPAAFCGLPDICHFTRGFLFFWLVGRLFNTVDMYGMSESDGVFHYGRAKMVDEQFLPFEHLLYSVARKSQAEHKREALLQVPDGKEGAETGFHLEMYPWPDDPFDDESLAVLESEPEQEEAGDEEDH